LVDAHPYIRVFVGGYLTLEREKNTNKNKKYYSMIS
jgi:hypothetical protein